MVHSVQPSDSIGPTSSSQTRKEQQKYFEIQFETSVISDYVAITGQNGSAKTQLSQIKNGAAAGQPPDQLASSLNQLIGQINNSIVPGKPAFPTFSFTTEGSQVQALNNFALSLQKLFNTAAEKGIMPWDQEQKLYGQLSTLINTCGQITPESAFQNLNGIIQDANTVLPSQYQLPKIPFLSRR